MLYRWLGLFRGASERYLCRGKRYRGTWDCLTICWRRWLWCPCCRMFDLGRLISVCHQKFEMSFTLTNLGTDAQIEVVLELWLRHLKRLKWPQHRTICTYVALTALRAVEFGVEMVCRVFILVNPATALVLQCRQFNGCVCKLRLGFSTKPGTVSDKIYLRLLTTFEHLV